MKTYVRLAVLLLLTLVLLLSAGVASAQTVSLSGTVSDNTANPISGAEIRVLDSATRLVVASGFTSPDGLYFLSIATGTYDVVVVPPAGSTFQIATVPGQVITGSTVLNVVLVPPGVAALSGRVVDAQGNVVPNAGVTLQSVGTGTTIERTTDPAGQYSFQVAPGAGDYSLFVGRYNWGNLTPPNIPAVFSLRGGPITLTESRILDLQLPFKRVSVHVQDPLGAAVPNVGLHTNMPYPTLEIGGVPFEGTSWYPSFDPPVYTDATGDATLWLFPTGSGTKYVITAAPPPETPYAIFNVYDVTVEQDMGIMVVLESEGPPPPNACPLSQGFWKNHREIWPIESLEIGSQTYTLAQLLSLLRLPPAGDASLILAHQLIAAKTNVYWGSDPAPISGTVTAMDSLLATYAGALPYKVKPSSKNGKLMTAAAETLDRYNSGALTPLCDPTAPTLALTVTERDIAVLGDRAMMAATIASLGHRERASLKVALDGARFNRFNRSQSRMALAAFIDEVRKLTRETKLARRDAQDLIDRASQILAKMK